jgi:protein-S-isoprenylcysteine O-methyltransferase Ste14
VKFNVGTILLILVALVLLGYRFAAGPWPPLRIAGAVISLISVAGVIIARLQLGRAFSVRAKATRLVTTGLYRRVRNPIYIFGCFLFVGLAMFLPARLLLFALLVVIPVQIARARREAAVLEAEFGDEYRGYRAGTWL